MGHRCQIGEVVLLGMAQILVGDVFAADVTIHRVLVAAAAELDDDVVDDTGKAPVAHQPLEKRLPRGSEAAGQRHDRRAT